MLYFKLLQHLWIFASHKFNMKSRLPYEVWISNLTGDVVWIEIHSLVANGQSLTSFDIVFKVIFTMASRLKQTMAKIALILGMSSALIIRGIQWIIFCIACVFVQCFLYLFKNDQSTSKLHLRMEINSNPIQAYFLNPANVMLMETKCCPIHLFNCNCIVMLIESAAIQIEPTIC